MPHRLELLIWRCMMCWNLAPHASPLPAKLTMKLCDRSLPGCPLNASVRLLNIPPQFMRMPSSTYFRQHHRSANPAANVFCQGEADANDTIFLDTPAVNSGQTAAQIFAGHHSKLTSIHPLRDTSKEQLLGSFQDRVCWHGAPDELIADNASVYNMCKFLKYFRDLYIRLWQLESYHQQQNYAESVWESIKHDTNRLLDSVYLGVDYHDKFILSVQTRVLFLNGIGSYTGWDPFLDYGEYYWTYNASSCNPCVFWQSCEEADEQEKQSPAKIELKLHHKEVRTNVVTQHPKKLNPLLEWLQTTVGLMIKKRNQVNAMSNIEWFQQLSIDAIDITSQERICNKDLFTEYSSANRTDGTQHPFVNSLLCSQINIPIYGIATMRDIPVDPLFPTFFQILPNNWIQELLDHVCKFKKDTDNDHLTFLYEARF